ncbi:hypothetical protein [Arthrobacter sp. HLT1-20]
MPTLDVVRSIAGKSAVLQDRLAAPDLTAEEKQQIVELNNRTYAMGVG